MTDTKTMEVRVLLFARVREVAGKAEVRVSLSRGSSGADVVKALKRDFPSLGTYLANCRLAVNQEFQALDREVPADAEVAVIPPVSGGS